MHKPVKWPLASISLSHIPASGSGRRAGLTQQQVAERLGRPQRYISRVERGLEVTVVELVEIGEALGFDPKAVIARVAKAAKR